MIYFHTKFDMPNFTDLLFTAVSLRAQCSVYRAAFLSLYGLQNSVHMKVTYNFEICYHTLL
jgi:hypothetical protein